jgi:hypothetical protein
MFAYAQMLRVCCQRDEQFMFAGRFMPCSGTAVPDGRAGLTSLSRPRAVWNTTLRLLTYAGTHARRPLPRACIAAVYALMAVLVGRTPCRCHTSALPSGSHIQTLF